MRCPNCGAKMKVKFGICPKCQTKLSDIKEASFNLVKKVRKEYEPERVVYTTIFPKDLSFKKTLLLCVFFGWMGAHLYFVARYFKAIMLSVMTGIFLFTIIPVASMLKLGSAGFLTGYANFMLSTNLIVLPCALGAIAVIMWAFDIIKLSTRHFDVPVVMPEKKK